MDNLMGYLGPVAVLAVALVLLAGLWNMLKGGSPSRSQMLMRWRVGLQFLAIIILMGGLYLTSR
ncbi:MAG: twin transmembrane helix small protein [Parvibaculum sp.]